MTSAAADPTSNRRGSVVPLAFATIAMIVAFIYARSSVNMFAVRLLLDGLVALLWAGGCFGIGSVGWDLLLHKRTLPVSLRLSGAFALGFGVISLVSLLLGLVGCLNHLSAWGMVGVGLIVTLLQTLQAFRTKSLHLPKLDPWLLTLAVFVGIAMVACFVPPGALWADAEPNGYDVVEYHFQIPREWYESGLVQPLRHNVFSYFPFGVEMHYLLAMHLNGGPYAGMYLAQLMHAILIAASVVATHGVVSSLGRSGTLAALSAGIAPWLLLLAPIGFNEGGLLLFGTLSVGILLLTMRQSSARLYAMAGLFAGFACGVKLTAVPMLVIIPAVSMLAYKLVRREKNISMGGLATYCVIAFVVFSPWLIRNLVWAGNPVFPEATTLLGKAHFSEEQVERWKRAHSPPPSQSSIAARVKAAADQILLDWRFGYVLLPLAAIALILSRQREDVILFLILALMLVFWLAFTHLQGRFFVLMIPFTAIVISSLRWKVPVCCLLTLAGAAGWARWQITYYSDPNPQKGTMARVTSTGVLGIETLDPLKPMDELRVPNDRTIVLVGDANPFWLSSVPMKFLRYRTVFDVDARGRNAIEAWCDWHEPLPIDAIIVIDPGELERMANTYRTPSIDAATYRDGRPYILER